MAEDAGAGGEHGSKIGGFLGKSTAGLPNWAWLLVIGAGIAAAYLLPKFFGGKSQQQGTSTGTDQTSGIGLAVDPTTGLPYAVEGLVPSGGLAGTGGAMGPQGPAGSAGPPGIPGTPGTPGAPGSPGTVVPGPSGGAGGGGAQQINGPVTLTSINYGPNGRLWGTLSSGQTFLSVAPGGTFASPNQYSAYYYGNYTLVKNSNGTYTFTPKAAGGGGELYSQISPEWPGNTTQVRMQA